MTHNAWLDRTIDYDDSVSTLAPRDPSILPKLPDLRVIRAFTVEPPRLACKVNASGIPQTM